VLDQPTRRRLFGLFADFGGAATTAQLAARLGMHPNGVRRHLLRMRDAGLVVQRQVAQPRGRPRAEWTVAPDAADDGGAPEAYRALARWLARSIPASPARLRDVERAGREIGRELAQAAGASGEQVIDDVLAALGFQPATQRSDGRLACRLRNCPYRDSVRENSAVVCTLHRGLTRGLLDEVAPASRLTRFIPHDPDRAGCEIQIDGLAARPRKLQSPGSRWRPC
jgi:predicted ArsR family transcriptional regulator